MKVGIGKPVCPWCGLRIEQDEDGGWRHLLTVAGLQAEQDHSVVISEN